MYKNLTRILASLLVLLLSTGVVRAQPGASVDLKKPQKFETRKLGSEKTGDKKFTVSRRFVQNTITHYNFFFNANEKIKQVLERAKAAHRDDYSRLLSFYNYSLESTSRFRGDLDSVIYKSTAGILLHDLRSNWVDNLYLLIGEAYFFRNDMDSAYLTFQFLNYAFSPKEKDGYDLVIGSNSNEGGSAFSIATNEKANPLKKALSRPPSRNESLVWQVRTYLANDQLPEAAALIQVLKYDPLFPSRLQTDLEELQALYFYRQNRYDSAAIHLAAALNNASNQQERARWEYLIAQLYKMSGQPEAAKDFYLKTIKHTIDPVLEVYALLNAIRQSNGTDDHAVQQAVKDLVRMARKDKYTDYRDIIYYTAAQIELDRNNSDSASLFLNRSIRYSTINRQQKNKSFLALADLLYVQKDFANARRFYDSVDVNMVELKDPEAFAAKKTALVLVTRQMEIIHRQDSLQQLAALPEADRDAYLKKLLRQLRRQHGLKEEEPNFGMGAGFASNNNNTPADLFTATDDKGGWYFNNNALKTRGFTDFRAKWGNRPNADNWQRSTAIQQQAAAGMQANNPATMPAGVAAGQEKPLGLESLTAAIPLTPEKMAASNDSVLHAQFALGQGLQEGMEDYPAAIDAFEKLLQRFPGSPLEEETLFHLYYCYQKNGDTRKMASVKQLMETRFDNGKFTGLVKNPQSPDSLRKKEGTNLYESIYNLFIEGNFEEAANKKKVADSIYGKNYWSPQLLYIESVYHIQKREDSTAKTILGQIVTLYPGNPMAEKAKSLIDVLGKRLEIEDYLTSLKIERPAEGMDTALAANPPPNPSAALPVRTAKEKPVVPVSTKITRAGADSLQIAKHPVNEPGALFVNTPAQPHYAALVMDKVDPVYVNEARNAFNRYNREKYYNKPIEIIPLALTGDIHMVLFGKFENAAAALDYIDKARKQAFTEIIPWMPVAKYSFLLITDQNLERLKTNKDLPAYHKFLKQSFPGIFR
jgi:tetratricopeptide (TPR) repeat protein